MTLSGLLGHIWEVAKYMLIVFCRTDARTAARLKLQSWWDAGHPAGARSRSRACYSQESSCAFPCKSQRDYRDRNKHVKCLVTVLLVAISVYPVNPQPIFFTYRQRCNGRSGILSGAAIHQSTQNSICTKSAFLMLAAANLTWP